MGAQPWRFEDLSVGHLTYTTLTPALPAYTEGTWTPAVTFSTPGNLVVVYSNQAGAYTRIGQVVIAHFFLTTSTFTHTTAAGDFRITGLPIAASATIPAWWSPLAECQGVTKAGYTTFSAVVSPAGTSAGIEASGSGVAVAQVLVADVPTGGLIRLNGAIIYFV